MPESVRLVIWDLDETFWKGTFTEGGIREYVQAHHDIVIELARRGIMSSICSKNDSAAILPILQEKGILEYFIFPSISWDPKGSRLAQLVETVQLRAATVMFIDDNPNNRAEAAALVPGLQIADETFITTMLDDPRFQGKEDRELTRLKQYKLLEQRKQDEEKSPGDNAAFLRSCDIRVYIEYDIESHIDRAIELVNRTNQLNYTKNRLSEDINVARSQMRDLLRPFDRSAGLVRVIDKYGDYGFVGFFMTGGMRKSLVHGAANTHLVHYCFSCRTLGMLIEAWVYAFLGRPELITVGEVLTDLTVPRQVDWVKHVLTIEAVEEQQEKVAPQIILYGGCEVNAFGVYLQAYTDKLDVYGNYVANGIFVTVNYAARLLDVCDRNPDEIAPELARLGLPSQLETGDIFASAAHGSVFVINLAMDAAGAGTGFLRHKTQDWTAVLSPNGLGWQDIFFGSDEQLSARLESSSVKYSAEQKARIFEVSKHLKLCYELADRHYEADMFGLMSNIIARVPFESKLIVVVDSNRHRDDKSGELRTVPAVDHYRSLVTGLAESHEYVSVVSISDAIANDTDILGGNHYSRQTYLRLAQNIVAAARDTLPRKDVPQLKRRINRLFAIQKDNKQAVEQAAEFVRTSYKTLLRRDPEPGLVERVAPEVVSGATSHSKLLFGMRNSKEFMDKWLATEPKAPVKAIEYLDPIDLWVPKELSVAEIHPKRVLIVGSCLSQEIQARLANLKVPCESDLYFVGIDLPALPESPVSDYDFQIIQMALRNVLPDSTFGRLSDLDEAGHLDLFDYACGVMRIHFDQAMRWNREHGLLTFIFAFIEPMQDPVGRLQPYLGLRNPVYFVRRLNETLAEWVSTYSNAYFVDLNATLSFFGRRFMQDDLITGFNHASFITNFDEKFDLNRLEPAGRAHDLFESKPVEAFHLIWRELIARFCTVRQIDQVKLVVVDLDDTLWRGVIAELDLNNLPPREGWPVGLWEALIILRRRGVLLAIISKNDEARVLESWPTVFGGKLSLDDFAIRRINWKPKPENMAEILAHVNLLPGNVLYIDDNPVERAAIKASFPEIRIMGGSPLHWRRILLWSPETQVATITSESAVRTEMVRAQVVREEQRQVMPRETFLASLNVSMQLFEVDHVNHPRFPRVLELINKTNQFNTTGRRWTREECLAAFAAGTTFYAFEVSDHYTDYGLVGVVILERQRISQFVMSCRVMGLDVEVAAVSQMGALLRDMGSSAVFAAMVETDRNQPCRNLYARCGFEATEGGWQRSLTNWLPLPGHVNIQTASLPKEPALSSR